MNNNLEELCRKAVKLITSYPEGTKVRVISHYDADGISSAAIISKALYNEGYDIHTSLMRNPFDKGLERISKEKNDLIIFCDMGSGQIETIEKIESKIIIVDHHQVLKENTSENVLQINANLCGINGNYEACGSTLIYSLAKALNPKNENLASLALIGAIGDKQYIGGFRGYNRNIIEESLNKDLIKQYLGIKIYGDSVFDALYFSIDPYYSNVSGNKENIVELLKKFDIAEDTKIEDLSKEKLKKLQSYLILILIKKGCEKNIIDTVIRPRYFSESINHEFERFADLLDACGKGGNRGLGLITAMGDKEAFIEAVEFQKEYKKKILNELLRLEKEGFKEKKGFRYFYSDNSSLGGVIGGIAINYLLDRKKPLLSIVKKDDEIHVSSRGNQHLVKKGLDLGIAMKDASIKLGGHGGGHAIASGATIDSKKETEFLEIVDEIICKQLKI